MSWNPGAEKAPLSFLLLGIVDGHVVIENDKQEERHAQHVGEDGELHVCDHPDERGSAPPRTVQELEPQGQSPVTPRIWSLGKTGRPEDGQLSKGAEAQEPASETGRDQAQEARGTENKLPSEVEKRRAEGTEGGTDRSLRRKEEGERGQARQPRRRRVAGGCRQEAGDRT